MSDMEEGASGGEGAGTSSDDSPVPPLEVPAGVLGEEESGTGETDTLEEAEVEVDLKAMADDYAKYLVVDSPKDVSKTNCCMS